MMSTVDARRRRIAVIGAGISGLACASELVARSFQVRVFDKSRGPGGRMSTRRVPMLEEGADFDHGAQYFTARAPEFTGYVQRWISEGVVEPWLGRIVAIGPEGLESSSGITQRFVGKPGMNSVCRHLSKALDIRFGTQIETVEKDARGWTLFDANKENFGRFDVVVSTAPAPQTAGLLVDAAPDIAERARTVQMQPCWAILTAFSEPLRVAFDGAFVSEGPLSWVARTSSKPGRKRAPDRWVLHANPSWSEDHLEEDADRVVEPLLEAFFTASGMPSSRPSWTTAHRWRYALAASPLQDGYLYDATAGIGACGDWAKGNRVEGAFLSGRQMARAVAQAM